MYMFTNAIDNGAKPKAMYKHTQKTLTTSAADGGGAGATGAVCPGPPV